MIKEHHYFVYILASGRNGTLYIGVTNSLYRRSFQHKQFDNPKSFTAKHNVTILVYYETFQNIIDAIQREKQLKGWNRAWKVKIIEKENPSWRDLFNDMM